ncbi:HAMP domain-containing protein [Agrobacterium rhizogenes]|uniref:ATP-binding protein n=1 Tax=Rhizobium rhizogenes TaxID=359 RepID=UPI000563058F|nr:ATP-binding protein [Rhizobium rhizogenes]NTH81193.1 HAMP domain-containing protein [Rhizobium rhizogenes]NTH87170.1 HAMP domain-containing protein [Rhizobium rhizogenes]
MKGLRTASIRTQILVLATLLIILVSVVATLSEPFIYGRHDKGVAIGLLAGRIERVLDRYRQARSPDEEDAALKFAATLGISAEKMAASQIPPQQEAIAASSEIVERARALLETNVFKSVENAFADQSVGNVLTVKVDADRALVFHLPVFPNYLWLFPAMASGILKIVIPLALMAYFSSWLITRPVVRFAAAAERASMDDSLEKPFVADGASEMRSLAASLNVMRSRILEMVDSRTRMLSSISHDLRTPLTRLRMRAERCEQPELQRQMLADIATLGSMIDESLTFLTNASHSVPSRKVDISSLLQTIATDFSDTGIEVGFEGPRRLTCICKPQAITRAITNVVENASRYATEIEIELQSASNGGVLIKVSDNGPGLTDALKVRALEPFFKADKARTTGMGGGFGLGLPTAEGIVRKGHGGTLKLLDRKPNGLIVEITLPPTQDEAMGRLAGDPKKVPSAG